MGKRFVILVILTSTLIEVIVQLYVEAAFSSAKNQLLEQDRMLWSERCRFFCRESNPDSSPFHLVPQITLLTELSLLLAIRLIFFSVVQQSKSDLGHLLVNVWRSQSIRHTHTTHTHTHTHTNTYTRLVGLLWTSDQLVTEGATYTAQNTIDEHACPQRDSNPRSQQSSRLRPTPYTARTPR